MLFIFLVEVIITYNEAITKILESNNTHRRGQITNMIQMNIDNNLLDYVS
jgi:hypothetical protein